jgi:hypothetical protein
VSPASCLVAFPPGILSGYTPEGKANPARLTAALSSGIGRACTPVLRRFRPAGVGAEGRQGPRGRTQPAHPSAWHCWAARARWQIATMRVKPGSLGRAQDRLRHFFSIRCRLGEIAGIELLQRAGRFVADHTPPLWLSPPTSRPGTCLGCEDATGCRAPVAHDVFRSREGEFRNVFQPI